MRVSEKPLSVEYAGEILSRYDIERAKGANELRAITRPRLFETSHALAQARLFGLAALGEDGWLKALKLEDYAPRKPRRSRALQQSLFTYPNAI